MKLLVSFIIVASPLVSETLTYYYCAESYSLAFLLAIFSVYLVRREETKIYDFALAVICLAVSLGVYQSNIGVAAFLCIGVLIIKILDSTEVKKIMTLIFKFMLFGVMGIVIYYGIYKAAMLIFNIPTVDYKGASQIGVLNILINLPDTIKILILIFLNFSLGKIL